MRLTQPLAVLFAFCLMASAVSAEDHLPGVKVANVFENVTWEGWTPTDDSGTANPLRPIVFTHAGDGSNRIFVAEQHGAVYVLANTQATEAKIFLDHRSNVTYKDSENEEGLLGLAFHPNYEKNGQFFLYYTTSKEPHVSILSRFTVSANNPNHAESATEEQLLRIPQPFWNHNGGGIAFGPDGMLYVALGDGGRRDDPLVNGQNLKTLLGSVLRIDVDKKDAARNYAIPSDNPFVSQPEGARGEIWAYGFRNIWGMTFDRETGDLWAADVGQDIWEEIDMVVKGGNYGWNLREATHKFGPNGADPRPDLIEPIFEYHHDVGKSITGGFVYRGKAVPALQGKYLYADYVSGKVWALDYDKSAKQVKSNTLINAPLSAVIAFGEDEAGELYYTVVSASGQGIFQFQKE